MFQLIDTLYITEAEVTIWAQDEVLVIQLPDGVKSQLPVERLASVVCYHFPTLNASALRFFSEKNIRLYILRPFGEKLIQMGSCSRSLSLWGVQRQAAQSEQRLKIIRQLLTGRALNCRNLLYKAIRERRDEVNAKVLEGSGQIQNCCRLLQMAEDLPAMNQIVKRADEIYTDCLSNLLFFQRQDFVVMNGKVEDCSPRFFALRNFLLSQLFLDLSVALESCGLNLSIGFLHQETLSEEGLVFDLMEELSPCLVDRAVLALINTRQVGPHDFITEATGQVRITEDSRRNIINFWQKRKQEALLHPYLNTKITLQMVPHLQGVLMTRYLRQEIDDYPPYIME